MQLRFHTGLTGEQYVSDQAWREARLDRCPNHPRDGCSFARDGTYERRTPAGTQVARWYCPESHTNFSLLPDFLAAWLPGTLKRLEEVVAHAEQTPSLMKAADQIRRDDVQLPGDMRWVRRRVRLLVSDETIEQAFGTIDVEARPARQGLGQSIKTAVGGFFANLSEAVVRAKTSLVDEVRESARIVCALPYRPKEAVFTVGLSIVVTSQVSLTFDAEELCAAVEEATEDEQ